MTIGTRRSSRIRLSQLIVERRQLPKLCPIRPSRVSNHLSCTICQDFPRGGQAVLCSSRHVTCRDCNAAKLVEGILICQPGCHSTLKEVNLFLDRIYRSLGNSGRLAAVTTTTDLEKLIMSETECAICKNCVMPPTRHCESGHVFCSYCQRQLTIITVAKRCPVCRGRFFRDHHHISNELLSNILERNPQECRHPSCTQQHPFSTFEKHWLSCNQRRVRCLSYCQQDNFVCRWTGPLHPDLADHLQLNSCAAPSVLTPGTGGVQVAVPLIPNFLRHIPRAFLMVTETEEVIWIFVIVMWHGARLKFIPYCYEQSSQFIVEIRVCEQTNPAGDVFVYRGRPNTIPIFCSDEDSFLQRTREQDRYLALDCQQLIHIMGHGPSCYELLEYSVDIYQD